MVNIMPSKSYPSDHLKYRRKQSSPFGECKKPDRIGLIHRRGESCTRCGVIYLILIAKKGIKKPLPIWKGFSLLICFIKPPFNNFSKNFNIALLNFSNLTFCKNLHIFRLFIISPQNYNSKNICFS